jgi:hypothetical protein
VYGVDVPVLASVVQQQPAVSHLHHMMHARQSGITDDDAAVSRVACSEYLLSTNQC